MRHWLFRLPERRGNRGGQHDEDSRYGIEPYLAVFSADALPIFRGFFFAFSLLRRIFSAAEAGLLFARRAFCADFLLRDYAFRSCAACHYGLAAEATIAARR